VGGAKKGKAIIIINPAEPPLIMRDTVHCLTETEPDQAAITKVHPRHDQGSAEVRARLPLVNGPVFDGNRVSVFLEVEGLGDYLPKYAGNLDIMTAAAARTAEMFAEEILAGAQARTPRLVGAPASQGDEHGTSRQENHRPRHDPARRHAPQAPPDDARADEVHRHRPRRSGRAADRSHPRRRPGRQLGQLRLPGAQRRGIPRRRDPADEAGQGLGAAAARHRHRRPPEDGARPGRHTIRVATHCTEADVSEQHITMARKLAWTPSAS
jgi:hypothetical protein